MYYFHIKLFLGSAERKGLYSQNKNIELRNQLKEKKIWNAFCVVSSLGRESLVPVDSPHKSY